MNSKHKTTNTVDLAARRIPDSMDYSDELRNLLSRAVSQAWDDEEYWEGQGKPHLRTFLKTTPLGLAIVDLAMAILEDNPPCPYDFSHTRHWCGNNSCRES